MWDRIQFRLFDNERIERFCRANSALQLRQYAPAIAEVRNAIIEAEERISGKRTPARGVYHDNGTVVPESMPLRKTGGVCRAPQANREGLQEPARERRPVYFLGDIRNHRGQFGHFLLETLCRAWQWSERNADSMPVMLGKRMFKYMDCFYTLIPGLSGKITLISQTARFDRVIVPGPSFIPSAAVHVQFKLLCERMAEQANEAKCSATDQPLYLSRAGLDPASSRTVVGEDRLERLLETEGFLVVRPETLSVSDQVSLFNRHQWIVSSYGSACHLRLFSCRPNNVVVLSSNLLNNNYILCDMVGAGTTCYAAVMRVPRVETQQLRAHARPTLLDDEKTLCVLKELGLIGPKASFDSPAPGIQLYLQRWRQLVAGLAARGLIAEMSGAEIGNADP